jgi:uncharacterized RDD family membrane protein YckC
MLEPEGNDPPILVEGVATKDRFFAMTIDNVLSLIVAFVLGAVTNAYLPPFGWLVGLFYYFAYFFLLEALWSKTLGKHLCGLVVLRSDGTKAGRREALLRTALRLFEVNPFLLGALPGAICVLATRRRQRFGDLLANTVVATSGLSRSESGPPAA